MNNYREIAGGFIVPSDRRGSSEGELIIPGRTNRKAKLQLPTVDEVGQYGMQRPEEKNATQRTSTEYAILLKNPLAFLTREARKKEATTQGSQWTGLIEVCEAINSKKDISVEWAHHIDSMRQYEYPTFTDKNTGEKVTRRTSHPGVLEEF